jgi:hypothetical protein
MQDLLSEGDMIYIRRLLEKNPDIRFFVAPIVISEQFRLRAIVVSAKEPNIQRATSLRYF